MNLLSFIFITISLARNCAANSSDSIKTIADSLGDRLNSLVEGATGYSALSKIPEDEHTKNLSENSIKEDIESLKDLFNERLSLAKDMATYAEFLYKNHTKDYNLDESYEYFDAKTGDESVLHVTMENELSGNDLNVSLNTSAVQTPTDLYQYTVGVLNSIDWTKKLDEKFKEHYEKMSMKAWQYVGLSNGVYRSYPGSLWRKANEDLQYFDVRQRSWYIEGSSPPKDMVIILDLSGSVIGNRLLIIKLAIVSLLDTLQENDFVNIIYFNKNAHYLKKCWNHLVHATERNKKILKAAVMSDTVKGDKVANVDKGFKLAFKTLKESREFGPARTSDCVQTIAFFTDGVEGDTVAEDVFDTYNSDKKIRVFTYLVGRENGSPFTAVKWIACSNKGFFYRIETLSDVRENIVKYINVLSRSRNREPKLTPLYLDAQGLGMATALVVPIFDKSVESQVKKQLGVLGSDILLTEILSKFPEPDLGAGGYVFAITNNGLVFFHPLLEQENEAALKHPANVYLSEVMLHFDTNETAQIAKAMIDKNVKEPSFNFEEYLVLAKYNDQFRVVERKLAYSYDHIINTTFSVGVATTDYGYKQIHIRNGDEIKAEDFEALSDKNLKVAVGVNWSYCSKRINSLEELKSNLLNSTELEKCRKKSKDLINLVIYDIRKLGSEWKPEDPSDTIKNVFFGSTSGLTFFKSSNGEDFSEKTSIKQEYFERAADVWEKQTTIFSATSKTEVQASKAVVANKVKAKSEQALWGVAGVHFNATALKEILHDEHENCKEEEDTLCYLVDKNGYVVIANDENENGKFFGMVEGIVMEHLINNSIYEKYNFTDVQATCEAGSDEESSAIRLLDPLFSIVNYAKWWTQTIALSLIQYSFYAAISGTNQIKAEDGSETSSCFKKIDLYYRKDDVGNPGRASLSFSGCERSYEWYPVKHTNLLLVVVDGTNSTFCKKTRKINVAEVDDYEGSCDLVDHYRVPGPKFGDCEAKESGECNSGKLLVPSIVIVVFQVLMLLCKG